jgi:hypothetical protein
MIRFSGAIIASDNSIIVLTLPTQPTAHTRGGKWQNLVVR